MKVMDEMELAGGEPKEGLRETVECPASPLAAPPRPARVRSRARVCLPSPESPGGSYELWGHLYELDWWLNQSAEGF